MKRARLSPHYVVPLAALMVISLAATPPHVAASEEARVSLVLSVDNWGDYITQSLPDQGVMTEIVRQSLAYEGTSISLDWTPWKRIEAIEIDTNNAFSFGWIKNSAREARWHYSNPFFEGGNIFISRADNQIVWKTFEDLKPFTIGITRGYSHGEAFDTYMKNLTITYANTDTTNIKKLLAKRIDLFAISPRVAKAEIEQHFANRKQEIHFIQSPKLTEWKTHFVCAKVNPDCLPTIEAFNKGLKRYQDSGRYAALVAQFHQL